MAYRLLREFRQAFTRLDTPPLSIRHHPGSAIAPDRAGIVQQQVSTIGNGEINVTILTMCRLAIAVGGDVSTMITPPGQAE
jgi:hypothetical protein